ncbi:hypothetical protein CEXT_505531 [Caerostris extrusa]|uniref:Uncharacterized protein n=1 Tax=Caerostris extrusa TaxID=172846 RepID=A0AAV4VNZ6_CAEEX|nr:hypothetical protein CEXT_505531 [Caerostris extrusa]
MLYKISEQNSGDIVFRLSRIEPVSQPTPPSITKRKAATVHSEGCPHVLLFPGTFPAKEKGNSAFTVPATRGTETALSRHANETAFCLR